MHRVTASAGCNRLGGAAEITAERIDVGDLSMTEMGCDPALHAQDEWLADWAVIPVTRSTAIAWCCATTAFRSTPFDRRVADPDRPLEGMNVAATWFGPNGTGRAVSGVGRWM